MKALYHSPVGTIILVSDGTSLTALDFGQSQDVKDQQDLPIFVETRRWLDLYFSGKKPDFTPPLKPQGTPFQQKVWGELLNIPYGATVSYGEIARRIGCRSAQAIGQAVHRNPISIIIPCHRVIGADGSLTGYASGLDIKQRLLQIEQ
jgi:methylated-DNA-[protein]-cysteine S-methyltransferase